MKCYVSDSEGHRRVFKTIRDSDAVTELFSSRSSGRKIRLESIQKMTKPRIVSEIYRRIDPALAVPSHLTTAGLMV